MLRKRTCRIVVVVDNYRQRGTECVELTLARSVHNSLHGFRTPGLELWRQNGKRHFSCFMSIDHVNHENLLKMWAAQAGAGRGPSICAFRKEQLAPVTRAHRPLREVAHHESPQFVAGTG